MVSDTFPFFVSLKEQDGDMLCYAVFWQQQQWRFPHATSTNNEKERNKATTFLDDCIAMSQVYERNHSMIVQKVYFRSPARAFKIPFQLRAILGHQKVFTLVWSTDLKFIS